MKMTAFRILSRAGPNPTISATARWLQRSAVRSSESGIRSSKLGVRSSELGARSSATFLAAGVAGVRQQPARDRALRGERLGARRRLRSGVLQPARRQGHRDADDRRRKNVRLRNRPAAKRKPDIRRRKTSCLPS